jgi:hypothetical protein
MKRGCHGLLCRLVKAYLPEEWGLVVLGITTAIADIVEDGFVGDQVILFDSSSTRTRFVYNTLQEVFGSELQVIRRDDIGHTAGPSTTVPTIGVDRASISVVQPRDEEANEEELGEESEGDSEDEAEDGSEDYSEDTISEFSDSDDDEEEDGESLHSEDTHERSWEYMAFGEGDDSAEDEDYDPGNSSDVEEESSALKDVNSSAEETEERFDRNEERIVAQEPGVGVVGVGATFQSTPSGICDVPEVREEPMEATTSLSDVIVAPSSVVLPSHGVTTGTESTTLSFAWALADHHMTLGDDGFYHDLEGVKYRRVGEEGNYTYEQVASILEGDLNAGSIPSPVAEAMVTRALDYADPGTPSEIRALIREQQLESETGEEVETQSSQVIPETQEMEQ